MRVLEAWFHPARKGAGRAVQVGRILCQDVGFEIESLAIFESRVQPFDPAAIEAKLRFLVENCMPRPYEQLQTLRSEYWSFTAEPAPSPPRR